MLYTLVAESVEALKKAWLSRISVEHLRASKTLGLIGVVHCCTKSK